MIIADFATSFYQDDEIYQGDKFQEDVKFEF